MARAARAKGSAASADRAKARVLRLARLSTRRLRFRKRWARTRQSTRRSPQGEADAPFSPAVAVPASGGANPSLVQIPARATSDNRAPPLFFDPSIAVSAFVFPREEAETCHG